MILKDTFLTRWLVWILARTLSRLGIFMPKSPVLISVYQSLTLAGQAAATFSGLLVLAVMVIWVRKEAINGENKSGVLLLVTLVFLSILYLFVQPPVWLAASYQLLLFVALGYTSWRGLKSNIDLPAKLAIFISMLALQAGPAGHLLQLFGSSESVLTVYKAGELMVFLSVLSLWMAFGRPASRWIWLTAGMPALGFTVFRVLDPATSGILAIWSTGMTLSLPWPFYTLGLWLAGVTVLACWRKGDPTMEGILLLASGGFAAQMTSHAFFGLAGLGLLGSATCPAVDRVPRSEGATTMNTGNAFSNKAV
jgi:hypothetical protein